MDGRISSVWLTVNRQCNFRCIWCYVESTYYQRSSQMSKGLAFSLVKIAYQAGARNLLLLGGEPTLWKYLKDFIERINFIYPDMQIVIITNGLLFSSNSFNSKMENLNFKVNLSVKASNEEQHRKLTKTNSFKNVSKAIRLLVEKRRLTGFSVTVNNKVINNLEEITEMVFENGVPLLSFEMCVPIFDSENRPQKDYVIKPCKLARELELTYGNIMKISKGKIIYQLSIPFCLFSSDFISDLKKLKQFVSGCHVMRRDGLIFDTQGKLLLCNCLCNLPIGQYGKDFHNYSTWRKWWGRKEVRETNERLLFYPSLKCIGCNDYLFCGGGCCLQWFSFDPEEILK